MRLTRGPPRPRGRGGTFMPQRSPGVCFVRASVGCAHRDEETRMTWSRIVDVLRQDGHYAWRSIARTPGFALLVVLTFMLGIGVNAATFSVLDTLFLKPPSGVERPEELRRIWHTLPGEGG